MIIAVSGLTEDNQGNKGSAGAGKTEVAKHLVEKHGFVEIAFADEIKRICMRLWDFTEEQLWGPSELRSVLDERYFIGYQLECGCIADRYESNDKGRIIEPGWWVANILQLCDDHEEHWHRGACIREEPVKYYLTPRHALQSIGESVNQVDPLAWTRFAMNVAKELLEGVSITRNRAVPKDHEGPIPTCEDRAYPRYDRVRGLCNYATIAPAYVIKGVVISDLRHLTELGGVQEAGGKCWRKKRNVATLSGAHGRHASEVGLNDVPDEKFDGIFPDGELDHLHLLIDSCMDVYTGRIIPYDPAQADVPPFLRE